MLRQISSTTSSTNNIFNYLKQTTSACTNIILSIGNSVGWLNPFRDREQDCERSHFSSVLINSLLLARAFSGAFAAQNTTSENVKYGNFAAACTLADFAYNGIKTDNMYYFKCNYLFYNITNDTSTYYDFLNQWIEYDFTQGLLTVDQTCLTGHNWKVDRGILSPTCIDVFSAKGIDFTFTLWDETHNIKKSCNTRHADLPVYTCMDELFNRTKLTSFSTSFDLNTTLQDPHLIPYPTRSNATNSFDNQSSNEKIQLAISLSVFGTIVPIAAIYGCYRFFAARQTNNRNRQIETGIHPTETTMKNPAEMSFLERFYAIEDRLAVLNIRVTNSNYPHLQELNEIRQQVYIFRNLFKGILNIQSVAISPDLQFNDAVMPVFPMAGFDINESVVKKTIEEKLSELEQQLESIELARQVIEHTSPENRITIL